MKGGDFAVGGADLRESTRTMPPSVWMAQAAMVRYTFAYLVATPSTTRYAPGLQEWVGLRLASAYFFFFFFPFEGKVLGSSGLFDDFVVKCTLNNAT